MKTLYISDMDGTLLDDYGTVSLRTSEILRRLADNGVWFSVATARTPATVEIILEGTATTNDLVVMTGATLWDRANERFEGVRLIPHADVMLMLDAFRQSGLYPFCYVLRDSSHLDVYHARQGLTFAENKFVELRRNLRLKTFHLSQACPADLTDRVVLFFAMGDREAITDVAETLGERTDCYVSYYKDTYLPDLWLLEIFGPGVSKAAGVERLKRHMGADRVVAFGDNLNDIPMLRMADVAVAVGNALPEVKEMADVVIGPNTDDAVARYIAGCEGVILPS